MKTFVARQPIYDQNNQIFAYELLYRYDMGTSLSGEIDMDHATQAVLSDAVTTFGLQSLTGGHYAFVNFTGPLLMSKLIELLPPEKFIVEILENTQVNESLLERVKEHKKQGYVFALDDYIGEDEMRSLLPLVDIIKVDFRQLEKDQRRALAAKLRPLEKRMLAEKVETEEEYLEAKEDGYTLFQGYYFGRPITLSARASELLESTCMQVFQELAREILDFDRLANIIRRDVDLTLKLLTHVNTLRYYRGQRVHTIRQALMRMGINQIRRWITLVFIRGFTGSENTEKTKIAFIRGTFADRIADRIGIKEGDDAFLAGMFSMLYMPDKDDTATLLDKLCISNQVRDALLGKDGSLGDVISFVKRYENGGWVETLDYILQHKLNQKEVIEDYIRAVAYADKIFA